MIGKAKINTSWELAPTLAQELNLGATPEHLLTKNFIQEITDGASAAGTCDMIFAKKQTVLSGATNNLDLNGTLKDVFGDNFNVITLCGVFILNVPVNPLDALNTTNLTIGGGTNPFGSLLGNNTATKILRPGHMFQDWSFGVGGIGTVVAGTGDMINITNGAGATNIFQVILIGRST